MKLEKTQAGEYWVIAPDGFRYTFSNVYYEYFKEWYWVIGGDNIGLNETQFYFDPFYTLRDAKKALERTIEIEIRKVNTHE